MAQESEFVTPESLLLDTAERLSRMRAGRIAVRLHLSRLGPAYAGQAYVRIAARMFDPLAAAYRCQLFILSNGDLVATGKDMPFAEVDAVVFKLRTLFDTDPLVHDDPYGPNDAFCSWYDLEHDYDAFAAMAEQALAEAKEMRSRAAPPLRPMLPQDLERLLTRLSDETVLSFLSAQAAVQVSPLKGSKLAFQELFVALGMMMQKLLPGIDATSDRWLFQHICAALDRRVLAGVESLAFRGRALETGLNLNAATVLDPAFAAFVRRFPEVRFTVEFQLIDIFAHYGTFVSACDFLHARGFRAAIDTLSPLALWMIADADLPVDVYKLVWSPHLAAGHQSLTERDPSALIRTLGAERVVLIRCDAFDAIEWGLRQGLSVFQGHFVDETLVAGLAEGGS